MLRSALLSAIFLLVYCQLKAQNSVFDVGLRFQKSVNLYSENGISLNYSSRKLRPDRLFFGFTYVTSRLGSAYKSNAIKQDNYRLSSAWVFRQKHVWRPFVRGNLGYFSADYGDAVFDVLPRHSPIFSTELGLSFKASLPLKLSTSLGYNFITGDGVEGPGTLYPVFYQATLSWDIFSKNK
jgi:hypothetical protein